MLESLESETPNIKDLSVEEQSKSELLFDPDTEVTKEDGVMMANGLRTSFQEMNYRKDNNWNDVLSLATNMKIISPKIFSDPISANENRELIKNTIVSSQDIGKFFNLAYFRILDPTKIESSALTERYQQLKEFAESRYPNMIFLVKFLQLMFPDRNIIHELNLDTDEALKKLSDSLIDWHGKDIGHFFFIHANARILFHNQMINPPITKKDWESAKEELEYYRKNNNPLSFSFLASNMKILAAKNIEITKNGIEIDMGDKQNIEESPPPLPQQRSF